MFRYNRSFFILSNLVITYSLFLSIFLLRYRLISFEGVEKRELDWLTLATFLFYTAVIILLNISLKVYEVNKISQIKESLFINIGISLLSAGLFSFFFFITKTGFARLVFLSAFILNPFILTFFNKILFTLTIKNQKPLLIRYLGDPGRYPLISELVVEYQKWFPIRLEMIDPATSSEEFQALLRNTPILAIDSDRNYDQKTFEILNEYEVEGGRIFSLIDFFSYLDQSLPAETIQNQHFELFSNYKLDSFYNRFIKRISDVIIASALFILSLPIFILTALLIRITSRGPVFYTQKRVGLKGKEFSMFKFRSMVTDAEAGKARLTAKNDSRITWIGKIIRPLRIDELPQLLNILNGTMSFIGPRPERKELIEKIIHEVPLFKKRLLVKPGLTGWAQVKYSYVNDLSQMNKKLSYDLYYINNLSILFDLKILLYTIETILFRRGAL